MEPVFYCQACTSDYRNTKSPCLVGISLFKIFSFWLGSVFRALIHLKTPRSRKGVCTSKCRSKRSVTNLGCRCFTDLRIVWNSCIRQIWGDPKERLCCSFGTTGEIWKWRQAPSWFAAWYEYENAFEEERGECETLFYITLVISVNLGTQCTYISSHFRTYNNPGRAIRCRLEEWLRYVWIGLMSWVFKVKAPRDLRKYIDNYYQHFSTHLQDITHNSLIIKFHLVPSFFWSSQLFSMGRYICKKRPIQ